MFPNGHKVRPLVGVTFWTLWLANTYGVLVIGQLISFITRHKWAKHLFKNLNRPWCTLNRPWRTLLLTHQTSLNIKPIIPYTLEAAKFAASKYHLFIVYILLVCILIDCFFFFTVIISVFFTIYCIFFFWKGHHNLYYLIYDIFKKYLIKLFLFII